MISFGATPLAADAQRLGSVGYREPKRLQTQFLEYFARMRRIVHQHNVTSVVILVVHNLSVLSNEPKREGVDLELVSRIHYK